MLNILRNTAAALVAAFAFAGMAGAQQAASPEPAAAAAPAQPEAAADLAEGEVRKVDKDNRKLTIKHGPLKSLDMPGMTMVFGVRDEAVLDQVKTGDKVRFQAEKIDGKFVVTRIEAASK